MYGTPKTVKTCRVRASTVKMVSWITLIFVACLGSSLIVLSSGSSAVAADDDDNSYEKIFDELKVFTDVLSIVERDYVREVHGDELVQGAIKGMLTALDPHSGYLEPEFYQDLRIQTKGEFGGLGIEITIRDGLLVVVAPMEGSPAEQAGILPGDKIVKIEGNFTKEFSLVDAVKRLRGPKGSPIEISVLREGYDDLIDVTIVRDRISVKSVRYRLLDAGFGYVRVSQFVESTADDLQDALYALVKENDSDELRGLVLDLRNNPGGLLTQAVRVTDLFLDQGVIVYTDGRVQEQKQKFFAQKRGTQAHYPIIILVNEGSASASEIVSGALQDHGRAIILGTQTFGKGSVQTITPLANGGALTLTTALYYTKNGRSIQATGVTPDIIHTVDSPPATESKKENSKKSPIRLREGDLPGAIANPDGRRSAEEGEQASEEEGDAASSLPPAPAFERPQDLSTPVLLERDSQLRRALELLKTYERFQPE